MWKTIALAVAVISLALVPNAWAQQPCEELGGTCMEGCETGYEPALATGCFDSVCCVPRPSTACVDFGGTCMEGCEAGYAQTEHGGCFDSVCCVHRELASPYPPEAYLECASDEDCTVSTFAGCCVCCNCTPPYAINTNGRQTQNQTCEMVRCISCQDTLCEPCAEPEGGWPSDPGCRDGRCVIE